MSEKQKISAFDEFRSNMFPLADEIEVAGYIEIWNEAISQAANVVADFAGEQTPTADKISAIKDLKE